MSWCAEMGRSVPADVYSLLVLAMTPECQAVLLMITSNTWPLGLTAIPHKMHAGAILAKRNSTRGAVCPRDIVFVANTEEA